MYIYSVCVCVCVCLCVPQPAWVLGNLAMSHSRGSNVKQCLSRATAHITGAYMGFTSEATPITDDGLMPQPTPLSMPETYACLEALVLQPHTMASTAAPL